MQIVLVTARRVTVYRFTDLRVTRSNHVAIEPVKFKTIRIPFQTTELQEFPDLRFEVLDQVFIDEFQHRQVYRLPIVIHESPVGTVVMSDVFQVKCELHARCTEILAITGQTDIQWMTLTVDYPGLRK